MLQLLQVRKTVSPTVVEIMGPKYIGGHDLDLSGSREVISHETIQIPMGYWWSIGPKSLSPSVFEIFGHKYIEVMNLTFLGHVTSSVT